MSLLRRHSLLVGLDPDARAFVLARNISTAMDRWAVNYRAIQYKKAGLWAKMQALYPFVKDVDTCKYSLKPNGFAWNFNLAYDNPALPTFNSQGLTLNGTWAITSNLVGSTGGLDPPPSEWGGGSRLSQSIGFWSTFADVTADNDFGGFGGVGSAGNVNLRMSVRKGALSFGDHFGSTQRAQYTPEADGLGLFSLGYSDGGLPTIWKNGAAMASGTLGGITVTSNIELGRSAGTPTTTKRFGLFYIANIRLTNAEHLLMYDIERNIQQATRF